MRLALLIAYDGTDFRGWARQRSNVRTVQGLLDERLEKLLKVGVRTMGAGRTDAGVHARGQVASFEAPDGTDPAWLRTRLNRWLAPEIVVRAAAEVADGFDARRSARRRVYEYTLYRSEVPDPFLERFALHVPHSIDLGAMRRASRALPGERDFASFCRAKEGSTTRHVRSVVLRTFDRRIVIRLVADSFCQQMVRSVVGTLLQIGSGEREANEMAAVIEARSRTAAGPVAPAKGLTLVEVAYPRRPFPAGAQSLVTG